MIISNKLFSKSTGVLKRTFNSSATIEITVFLTTLSFLEHKRILKRLFSFIHSSNQLTELPREVCQMPLQVLLVPDNMLSTLPKEIGKMNSLAELDASNNRLTQVPMTLGDCAGLRALDLSNNQLGLLPLREFQYLYGVIECLGHKVMTSAVNH